MNTIASRAELENLIKRLRKRHGEQTGVIDALSPLALAHAELLQEWAARGVRHRKSFSAATLPIDATEALRAAQVFSEAMGRGFPGKAKKVERLYDALSKRPSPIKKLCLALLAGETEPLTAFLLKHNIRDEDGLFSLLLTQVCRAMAARAALGVPHAPEDPTRTTCPVCGEDADMSIIHEQEGKRLLHCSLCGSLWRYSRTACPRCGVDKPKNITVLFDEKLPHERAEVCAACNHYILSVDARPLEIPAELAYYVTLGMGHLDVLAQEEGALPGAK